MKEQKLISVIREEIQLLESWANESKCGGWSTHQVDSQMKRASYLKGVLYDLENN